MIVSVLFSAICNAQGYNSDKVAMSNYLIRMYEQSPFDGVKLIDDYYSQYLISVVVLEQSDCQSANIMDRVSEVEAQSQANSFFNGSAITETDIVRINEKCDGKNDAKVIKKVRKQSFGFVKALELLTKFEKDGQVIYFYSVEVFSDKKHSH